MRIEAKFSEVRERYRDLVALGRDPSALAFDSMSSPTEGVLEGRPVLLFGTNNYLGTTFDPACIDAAVRATQAHGVGTTGSRIANGTYAAHRTLEGRVAKFYGRRAAVVFSTGYMANLGAICALAGHGDYLLIDADSHASIYDAARMSGAEIIRFRHNSAKDLGKKLRRLEGREGVKLVVVEGIYSMLGDAAPLAEIAAVTRAAGSDVYLMVDEAHSLGVLGARGRGKSEADGVEADCDFIVGTFSKSLGTIGGFCTSDIEGFDAIRAISRPYMFTASTSPGVAAAAEAAFDRIDAAPELRETLWRNVEDFYGGLAAMGFELGPEPSPVVAVKCPDKLAAVTFWNALIEAGLYTNIAVPPATPNALSLLRASVSAAHTPAQIAKGLEIFASEGARLGLIGAQGDRRAGQINGAAVPEEDATQPRAPQATASAAARG